MASVMRANRTMGATSWTRIIRQRGAQHLADRGFARRADEDRVTQSDDPIEMLEYFEILRDVLRKSKTGIEPDLFRYDARPRREGEAELKVE